MPPGVAPMPNQPASGPQMQQPAARVSPPQYFNGYVNEYAMHGHPQYHQYLPYPYFVPSPAAAPPTHPAPPPPQPAINGGRQSRPTYPHQAHPPAPPHMQRPPATQPNIIPRRTRKILSIVDPDSRQEIKPEKAVVSSAPNVATKPTPPVKIGPPVSRPLSLVSDPADSKPGQKSTEKANGDSVGASKPEPASAEAKPVQEAKASTSETVDSQISTVTKSLAKVTVEDSQKPTVKEPVAKDSCVSSTEDKPSQTETTPDPKPVTNQEPKQEALPQALPESKTERILEGNSENKSVNTSEGKSESKLEESLDGVTSDVSSSTFVDVRSGSADVPLTNIAISSEEQQTVSKREPEEGDAHESLPAKPSVSEEKNSKEPGKMKEPSLSSDDKSETPKVEEEPKKPVKEVEPETQSESRPSAPSMVFKPGQRRVYPLDFIQTMREYANTKKAAEIEKPLRENNILKGEVANIVAKRSNSRDGGHSSRMGSGSNSDSRTRAFPSPMQFSLPSMRNAAPPVGAGLGSDAFDLQRARSQPPPMLKSAPSGRDGDPRGSRNQGGGRGGRHGGPMRSTHMPVDQFVSQPPVEKLKRSENAWSRSKETEDEITSKVKEVRSLLNKLTLEKFDRIFQQIVDIDITTLEVLTGIVKEIFEKSLYEPKFSSMYAELCKRLDMTIQPILDKKEPSGNLNFRRILLNNCKEEFTRFSSGTKEGESSKETDETDKNDSEVKSSTTKPDKELTPLEKEEEEMKALKAKRRMLANIRFIGELYLKDLLRESIIHKNCIRKLLTLASESYEEEVLEAVCKLISKTGAKLSTSQGASTHIDYYFNVLLDLSKDKRVPARIRFMIQDLVDQRDNNWKVRREEAGAKTIAEIHKDIEEKEKAKQDAANAMRERKHRNQGSRMDHGRGMGSQHRLSMTMASASKGPSSGISRTNMMLERGLNRSSMGSLPGQSSMRLGPKSSLGSSGPSLRPRTSLKTSMSGTSLSTSMSNSSLSGSRFSALGNDPDRSSVSNPGPDALRTKLSGSGPKALSHRRSMSKVEAPPPSRKVELMEPAEVKRKAKSIYDEFLAIESIEEFTICMEEEVKMPNYQSFIENIVKLTIEGKTNAIPKAQKLVSALLDSGKVSAKLFLNAFEKYGPELMNLEMDYPLATELYSGVVVAAASTKEFKSVEGNGDFGIGFVRKIFDQAAEKNGASKLVVMICSALMQLEKTKGSEASAKELVIRAYRSLDVDLSAEMNAWDDMMGPRMLDRMLEKSNMGFLLPSLPIEKEVKSVLEGEPSEEKVFKALGCTDLDLSQESGIEVVKGVIRVALDVVFSEEATVETKLENVLKQCVANALLRKCKEGSSMPRSHQMGALCAVQMYLTRKEGQVPATVGEQQTASTIFLVLYGDLVEEETFRSWQDDTGVTMRIGGKEKMLVDTSRFFKWLDEAEEE